MADGPNSANLVFGVDCQRCPVTGRHFEQGSGALTFESSIQVIRYAKCQSGHVLQCTTSQEIALA